MNLPNNECHQHKVKIKNIQYDLELFELTKDQVEEIQIQDLTFEVIQKDNKQRIKEVKEFINRYEWLGKINHYWNYAFALTYKEKMVTVCMIGTPTMFSRLLGEGTKDLEQTIHRGASCSIAPKNAGSFLIANAIKWMVQHTPYRVFSGYSTPSGAFEYGYIYQSLNAILVSKDAGTRLEYLKPGTQDKWLSDRHLRKIANYKRIAKKLGYEWEKSWNTLWKIHWHLMPERVEKAIRNELKEEMKTITFRAVEPKFKYVLIKGLDKRETKSLLKRFKENNPRLVNPDGSIGLPYPKKDQDCKNVAISENGVESEREIG